MSTKINKWFKKVLPENKRQKPKNIHSRQRSFEHLETREMLSGSNAIDRLDFGNLASEAAHIFEPSFTSDQIPAMGTGTAGASAGLTYRKPLGSQEMVFTMAVDPNLQNYLTVRLWGNDIPGSLIFINGYMEPLEEGGGYIPYPNRFMYLTINIPISMTTGKSSVELDLTFGGGTSYYRPIYTAYTHTDPYFEPDSEDPTGTKPILTGQATLDTLTETEVNNNLLANRQNIYNSGGYFDSTLNQQVIVLNGDGTWSAPAGAPQEVVGLDFYSSVSGWMSANPTATHDQWRNKIAYLKPQPGYTPFPDSLLGVLTTTYMLDDLKDSTGTVLHSTGHYHDPSLITRIVAAIDGVTYMQDLDGGIMQQGSEWSGLCSTPRTTGGFIGTTERLYTYHGGGDLQGCDTYALGWTIIQLLNDPTAAPILQSYLTQSIDADLNGGSMMRAYAWERLLANMASFYKDHTGGVVSQHVFQIPALYSSVIALNKLQALHPNASYTTDYSLALTYVKEMMGLIPDTHMRGVTGAPYPNYDLTLKGLGEANGALSCGFDGGGYGQHLPWMLTRLAQLAAWDNDIDTATFNAVKNQANNVIDAFDQFISTLERATVDGSGVLTSDVFSMGVEPYITFRDVKNINSAAMNFNAQYWASDPNGALNNAYAKRSAYLNFQYGITPGTGSYTGNLNYLRDLAAYENTLKSLIGVNPNTLTPLPGEPGQPDFAWADPQAGAVAFINHGERFYMNADWRNYDWIASQNARIHYTTDTVERGALIRMPFDSTTVQPDGNYTSTSIIGVKVVRYGDYLFVLNQSTTDYSAKLPVGVGVVEDIISQNLYSFGSTVSVPAGQSAIFWLDASSVIGQLGASATGADIGSVGLAGSNSYANGVYTVSGAGADIGGTVDALRFVSTSATGDVTISAQIASQTNTNTSAKAGVMIRDGSAANAAYAAVLRTPSNGIIFQWRSTAGGNTAWAVVPTPLTNAWVKLTRSGNDFSAYYSIDGVTWTQIGATQSISLASTANIGLAVSSHTTSALSTATFSNVSLNTGIAPIAATAASATLVTSGPNANKQANLSVLGADDGGETGLTYTWYLTGTPPEQVTFSGATNGTNAAKNITATFATEGVYNFRVIIKDSGGAIATNDVSVTVAQIPTTVSVTSVQSQVSNSNSLQLYAAIRDQFGQNLTPPDAISWSIDAGGIGSVDQVGKYTAPASGTGTAAVRATYGSISGTKSIAIVPNIEAQWHLDSSYADSSGNNRTLTAVNNPTFVAGQTNNGLSFNGINQYAYRSPGVLNTSQPFSVSAWVYWDGTTSYNTAVSQDGTSVSSFFLQYRGDTHQFSFTTLGADTSSNPPMATAQWTTAPTANTWYHLVGVYTGSHIKLYVNGSLVATTSFPTVFSATGSTVIGAAKFGGRLVDCWHGRVDEVQLYARSLSDADVANLYGTTPIFTNAQSIGNPWPAGTYSESAGTVTMSAGGADIWGTGDQFHFAYLPITGNTTITARVVSLTNTHAWSKAGVMIRNSTDAGSANVMMLMTPTTTNGSSFQWRSSLNGTSSYTGLTGIAPSYWIRLVRSGNTFTAYRSPDNVTWTQLGSPQTISMNSTALVGLAITSHLSGTAATAVFDNITITGTQNTGPSVATAASATPNPVTSGTTATLSALGADDGGEANLTYTWALAGNVPGNVTFNRNGTNAAKSVTATFTKAGIYNFLVTIKDGLGLIVTSSVAVTVNQTFTSIAVSPATPSISPLGVKQFTAVAKDQFGKPMASQPGFTWSLVSGSGSIDPATGLYTASATGTTATIRATSGSVNGSTTISIINQKPLLAASVYPAASANPLLGHTTHLNAPAVDDAGEANLIYTWSVISKPTGAADPIFIANGTNAAKNIVARFTQSGTYSLKVTVTDNSGLTSENSLNIDVTYGPETYTWDGGSTVDNNWSTPGNWSGDIEPLAGDHLVFPAGATRLENINNFPVGTTFSSISVSGSGYKITNGGNTTPASIQVQPGVQFEADKIVTGTLTIGAGAKITITPIAGGPLTTNSSLTPLAASPLQQISGKSGSQQAVISTAPIASGLSNIIAPTTPNPLAHQKTVSNRNVTMLFGIAGSKLIDNQIKLRQNSEIKPLPNNALQADVSSNAGNLKKIAKIHEANRLKIHFQALQAIDDKTDEEMILNSAKHIHSQKHTNQSLTALDVVMVSWSKNF